MVTAKDRVAVKSLLTSAIRMTGATTMIDRLRNAVRRLGETEYDGGTDTFRDPLAHPALKAMSSRELADLPFPRHSRASRCR